MPPPVKPKLPKDQKIQPQRPRTAHEPARIHKHIPRIPSAPLSLPTPFACIPAQPAQPAHHRHPRTAGLVRDDGEDVGEVADAGEEEEEHGDALCAFAAVVEQQLGDAAAEVERGAEVAEDLAPEVEVCFWIGAVGGCRGGFVVGVVRVLGVRGAGGQPPAEDAGGADEEEGAGVVEDRRESGGIFEGVGRGGVGCLGGGE